jgi:hypothetical protein
LVAPFGRLVVVLADLAGAADVRFGAVFFGAFGLIATSGRSFGREE